MAAMNKQVFADQLDQQIEVMIAGRGTETCPEWASLLRIASELRALPSPEFKDRLKADLIEESETTLALGPRPELQSMESELALAEILPTLGGKEFGIFPADHRSFLVSFVSHAAMVALIVSGIWAGHRTMTNTSGRVISALTFAGGHGGGGGGDHSAIAVSKGTPPKFSNQQFAQPTIVVRNSNSKLQVEPTVLGPPNIKLPESNQLGDLMSSNAAVPSNGTGAGMGMGSGAGGGSGSGIGAGVGPGANRGFGGGVFAIGGGVTAPRAIDDPEPEYSDEARKIKQQGTVILSIVVDPQGHPRSIHVARSLGLGLDEKAVEAVRKWKFEPGTKDGQPVAVQVNVEVNFRLY
jgi:protein TonB